MSARCWAGWTFGTSSRPDSTCTNSFLTAYWAEALIEYYEWTKSRNVHQVLDESGNWVDAVGPDPRIPAAIKAMLDWTWHYAWNDSAKNMAYNAMGQITDPTTQYCDSWRYNCCGTSMACTSRSNEILYLSASAFAWYYSITGDATYQAWGDTILEVAPRAIYAAVNASTDTVTTRVPHGIIDGELVRMGALEDYISDSMFYATVIDPYTVKLSSTPGGLFKDWTSGGVFLLTSSPDLINYSGKVFSQSARWSLTMCSGGLWPMQTHPNRMHAILIPAERLTSSTSKLQSMPCWECPLVEPRT